MLSALDPVLRLKLSLLTGNYIKVSEGLLKQSDEKGLPLSRIIRTDNIYTCPWIFLRLSKTSRVRMVVVPESAPFELCIARSETNRYDILDSETRSLVASGLELEEVLHHCPKQLFYNLYKFCFMDCKFCPLPITPRWSRDTLGKMLQDLDRFKIDDIDGIGFTAGIPAHLSGNKVALEMARLVKAIRVKIGPDIPIGVSPMHPSREVLVMLKASGANEVRINLEVFNFDLAKLLMTGKDPEDTLLSIADAVEIFGRGKVSSNLILGIGETDDDVIAGVVELAKLGAIATLYPWDPVPEREEELSALTNGRAGRPNAERLWKLAKEHKRILGQYDLDPKSLKTMCPACGASHIMPSLDF